MATTAEHGEPRGRISKPALALIAAVEVVLVLAVFAACQYTRPLPELSAVASFPSELRIEAEGEPLPLPLEGQAALALEGMGTVLEHNVREPVPIASTTKIMTALLILERHPLEPGEDGPAIPITRADEEAWWQAVQQDESNVEVRAGTELTLRDALEAVLVASGNNVARILARWDSGTLADFVAAMNARAAELGMEDTTYTDVSGLDEGNMSTATDLLILAQEAMRHPVFAEIVGMEQADLPVVGVRENTNVLLGQDGFVGIKTGQTEAAGACLVWAVELPGDRTLYGVVLGQPERDDVFVASSELAAAAPEQIETVEVITAGERVGNFTSAWGAETDVVAAEGASLEAWAGDTVTIDVELEATEAPIEAGEPVGELRAESRGQVVTVDLVADEALEEPGARWRLTHN